MAVDYVDGSGSEIVDHPIDAKRYLLFVFDEESDLATGNFKFHAEQSEEFVNLSDAEAIEVGRAVTDAVSQITGYSAGAELLQGLFGGR